MQKITDYLIGAFIFMSSVFYIPGQNFHDSQKVLFQIAAMLFFALFLSVKPERKIRNIWISSYLIYSIVIFIWVKQVQPIAITPLISIFLMVALYYTFANYIKKTDIVYKAIQGIIIVNVIFIVFQLLKIDPLLLNDVRQPNTNLVGLFGHPMNMGIFCSVVLPYVLSKSKIWAILTFLCMLASFSYISIALGIVGVLLYLYFEHRKVFKIAISISLVFLILSTVAALTIYSAPTRNTIKNKFTHRYDVNYPLLKAALSNPYHGYGLGTFSRVSPQVISKKATYYIGVVDVPWCDYIGCMLTMGVGVLFIFFGLFKQTLRRFIRAPRSKELTAIFCSLSTIPIGIMFHSYMNYINVGVICVALFALYDIKLEEVGSEN